MKKILKKLFIFIVLAACVPFIPPICKRYTKPLYKNYIDQKEWYENIDHQQLAQVRDYCQQRGFSTGYYILVDFSKPSGKRRFFIYDLKNEKGVLSSYCMHGSGRGNTDATPKFSNEIGSGCSCLGRFIMVGKGSASIKNSIRLRGLDKTNNLAEARGILIHSARKVTRFYGQTDYIPLGTESRGCFTVSRECVNKVMQLYENSSPKRPILMYAKYK